MIQGNRLSQVSGYGISVLGAGSIIRTMSQCADADVPAFHEVCGALRDVAKNPEWKFVREAPTWHGRRVATRAELFA